MPRGSVFARTARTYLRRDVPPHPLGLASRPRKALLTLHVSVSVALVGATASGLALGLTASGAGSAPGLEIGRCPVPGGGAIRGRLGS